eukprot:6192157-Pleurochrysis_carterae.AAC.2
MLSPSCGSYISPAAILVLHHAQVYWIGATSVDLTSTFEKNRMYVHSVGVHFAESGLHEIAVRLLAADSEEIIAEVVYLDTVVAA